MRKLVTVIALGTILIGLSPLPARAGAVDAALALGAFAVFSAITAPFFIVGALAQPFYAAPPPVAYGGPPVVYVTPPSYPVVYGTSAYQPQRVVSYSPPPPPAIQREVVYPHGRYVLYGDGVTMAYQWVWIANPPPPPGAAPPTIP